MLSLTICLYLLYYLCSDLINVSLQNSQPLDHQMQVASLDSTIDDVEYERYHKFKTYRELSEQSLGETAPGVLLCDRHNYFVKFHDHLKKAAWEIINSVNYEQNSVEQVMELFRVLKITPRVSKLAALKTTEKLVQVEVDCDFDAFFLDLESNIYCSIIHYFRDMLN